MTDVIPSRRERRMAETRRALVQAAHELFRHHGFDETTIDEITERADVAPRTFFRYFPSKEAVLFAEFDELNGALLAALTARPAEEAPLVSLHAALRQYVEAVQSRLSSLAWVVRTAEECRGVGLERAAMRQRLVESLTEEVATRMHVDARIDPRPMVWVSVLLSCTGAAIRAAVYGDGPSDAAARFDDLIAETASQLSALRVER